MVGDKRILSWIRYARDSAVAAKVTVPPSGSVADRVTVVDAWLCAMLKLPMGASTGAFAPIEIVKVVEADCPYPSPTLAVTKYCPTIGPVPALTVSCVPVTVSDKLVGAACALISREGF